MPFPDTTGNRTYLQMVDDIRDHIGKANNTTVKTQVQNIVKNAVRQLNRDPWNFNRTTQNVTLSTDTATYTLSDTTIRKTLVALYLDSNSRQERTVEYVEFSRFSERIQNHVSDGPPVLYTFRNLFRDGIIEVFPRPTSAENAKVIKLNFFKRIAWPGADGTAWDVPEWFEGCIYWTALAEAHLMLTHDERRAAFATQKAQQEIRQAKWQDQLDSTQARYGMRLAIAPPGTINNSSLTRDSDIV